MTFDILSYSADTCRLKMGRRSSLQERAVDVAKESTCRDRHGALVTRGNRLYASGCNNVCRTTFLGKLDFCQHAEMNAATSFVNQYLRRLPQHQRNRKIKKCVVWCVRVIHDSQMTMSLPCQVCLFRLKDIGFRKIAYSNRSGVIEKCNLSKIHSTHLSLTQVKLFDLIRW